MQLFSSDVLRVGATEEPSPDRAHPPGHVVPATCCSLCGRAVPELPQLEATQPALPATSAAVTAPRTSHPIGLVTSLAECLGGSGMICSRSTPANSSATRGREASFMVQYRQ